MSRFDFRIETYPLDPPHRDAAWGAKPHIWQLTTDVVKAIVLDERRGKSQKEAAELAARAARKYIATQTVEDI